MSKSLVSVDTGSDCTCDTKCDRLIRTNSSD